MEDYIRGVLCGYLLVQNGMRDDTKRKRTFVVLSDSRIDYYLTDPRPSFTAPIDATYFMTDATRVHHYLELNPRAPPNSICLTTDKCTDVYVAGSEEEAATWYRHISERLDAISTMLKGSLMLRKVLSADKRVKRLVLRTKYRWKLRYVELGRSTLRFCKQSDHKTKTMKQFALTASSFAAPEDTTYLQKLSIFASYSIPVQPAPKTLKAINKIEKQRRQEEERSNNGGDIMMIDETRPGNSRVSAHYPFIVTTGQSYLLLAAPTEQIRTHWILAIRMRIIALKYRHNGVGGPRKELGPLGTRDSNSYQLQAFVETQVKPGGPWKQFYVELDNGMLRVKKSERKLGSIFEVQLVPTCQVSPLLEKANAFMVRSLGREVAFAPGSSVDARRWMELIRSASASVDRMRCQQIFHEDIQALLRRSVVYALEVPSEADAGLVVEKHNKRIFVLSHTPSVTRSPRRMTMAAVVRRMSSLTVATSANANSPSSTPPLDSTGTIIPQGSVLVGITQFGMTHDSVDTIWHVIRQKKGCYKQAKCLVFRVPSVKEGIVRVKFRVADEWMVLRCRLANGIFHVEDAQTRTGVGDTLLSLALRDCDVELFRDDDCTNGIKLSVATNRMPLRTAVLMNVAVDNDAFLWFSMLHMEISVAQNSVNFPINIAMLDNIPLTSATSDTSATNDEKILSDQSKNYRECTVSGIRVEETEKYSREQERGLIDRVAKDRRHERADSMLDAIKRVDHSAGITDNSVTLNPAEVARFFQHLDAADSGKVASAGLVFTMKLITKHIQPCRVSRAHFTTDRGGVTPESSDDEPLSAFFAAIAAFNSDGSDTLGPEQFSTVMANVTHPSIVELVRKASHNGIQCI